MTIVVLAPNWLGDAVMALPAIADIRRHFDDATMHVAARPSVAPLFALVDGVESVVTLPSRSGVGSLRAWKSEAAALVS
ncbi:MAG: lipopolysaccharide heptosyltransferase II, partial [Acidobacteria bacterium]|nr:lipopolysaccharide heptosyltransferase II [Acidobacteriota bacterium]